MGVVSRAVGGFPPWQAWVAPLGVVEASPRVGGFQIRASLGPLALVSKVHVCVSPAVGSYLQPLGGNQG